MLAIITKMTLTQVSTWFANARRRLKKESKLGYKDRDADDSDVESIGSHENNDEGNVALSIWKCMTVHKILSKTAHFCVLF